MSLSHRLRRSAVRRARTETGFSFAGRAGGSAGAGFGGNAGRTAGSLRSGVKCSLTTGNASSASAASAFPRAAAAFSFSAAARSLIR